MPLKLILEDTQNNCGCTCHSTPGVSHVQACCDAPPATSLKMLDTLNNDFCDDGFCVIPADDTEQ